MYNKSFNFNLDQVVEMAKFVSELVRQGVTFTVAEGIDYWKITLTGGY